MKKRRKFNDIFNECLERLLVEGETVEQCLRSYPEQAGELEPLLQTALATRQASAIQPRPEFRARARYQFGLALQEIEERRRRPFFAWQPRWATVVATVLVLLLAGSSTVVAAGNSMPDEPLYPVKLATEQVRLALTPSALGKVELYAKLADKRVAEIVYVANKGKPEQVERVTQRLNSYLARVAALALAERGVEREEAGVLMAPPPPAPAPTGPARGGKAEGVKVGKQAKLRDILSGYAAKHPQALRAVLKKVPASAKPALRRAIAASEANYEKALEALE
jgi:hypothetical protein